MDLSRQLQIIISARDDATQVLQRFGTRLDDVQEKIRKSAIAFSAIGVATTFAAKGFIDAAGQMEATKTAFNTLIGNSKEAEKTLKSLFELEARTPFTIETVLNESKKLLAMGTSAKDLTKTLEMLGDVAAGVGFEKLPQLTLAFGQIQAKGRLMGTELRQLTEAGFNLAEAMGVSSAQLDEMISNGEVGFEDVRLAFEKVTSEGGRFNGMMENLAQTTPGKLSTLESSVFKLKVAIGEALLPAVNQIIDALLPAIEKFSAWASEHEKLVAIAIALGLALGAIGAAVLILGPIIGGLIAAVSLLGTVISGTIATIGLIVAILGGPLTLIILAIGAAIAVLAIAWKNNWFGIRDKTEAFVNWFKEDAWPIIKFVIDMIMKAIKFLADGWIAQFNAIKSVIDGVIGRINDLIEAGRRLMSAVKGGIKIPGLSFQHGGFVPGPFNQAVPALLHGGERIIPRNGVDVNPGIGGGGGGITINMNGNVNMDSDSRIRELAEAIISKLGRENELAAKGVSI